MVILLVTTVAFVISSLRIGYLTLNDRLSLAAESMLLRLAMEVNSELALVSRMADSRLIRRYLLDPDNRDLRNAALDEFADYRKSFKNNIVFWINDIDKLFHYNDSSYILDPSRPENYWYNLTLHQTEKYNFNVNYNPDLQQANLWINAPVFQVAPNDQKSP
ncbi:MAG: methyl-accepting chemotaxis protein, partial [Candidatus Accumulibacter sp.]|nr:methyl-accepting chemotaxis protein [Accumulibacter sp.]